MSVDYRLRGTVTGLTCEAVRAFLFPRLMDLWVWEEDGEVRFTACGCCSAGKWFDLEPEIRAYVEGLGGEVWLWGQLTSW